MPTFAGPLSFLDRTPAVRGVPAAGDFQQQPVAQPLANAPAGEPPTPPRVGPEHIDDLGRIKWLSLLAPLLGAGIGAIAGGKSGAAEGTRIGTAFTGNFLGGLERGQQIQRSQAAQKVEQRQALKQDLLDRMKIAIDTQDAPSLGAIAVEASNAELPNVAIQARTAQKLASAREQREIRESDQAFEIQEDETEVERLKRENAARAAQTKQTMDLAFKFVSAGDTSTAAALLRELGKNSTADIVESAEGAIEDPTLKFTAEDSLRKELFADDQIKNLLVFRDAYVRTMIAGRRGDVAGDIALIFSFMKMQDPTSVIREGEQATARNAAGILERTRNLYNRFLTGDILTKPQRKRFMELIKQQFSTQHALISRQIEFYTNLATKRNLDIESIMPSGRFGDIPTLDKLIQENAFGAEQATLDAAAAARIGSGSRRDALLEELRKVNEALGEE